MFIIIIIIIIIIKLVKFVVQYRSVGDHVAHSRLWKIQEDHKLTSVTKPWRKGAGC